MVIVNIKLSMLIIFPQTELLVNLVVFNLLELAGRADIAEYECRRKHSGLPSKHEGQKLAVVFPCLPNKREKGVMGCVFRYYCDQKRGERERGGLIVFTRVLWSKLRSNPALNYWNPQTVRRDESVSQLVQHHFLSKQITVCTGLGKYPLSREIFDLKMYIYINLCLYLKDVFNIKWIRSFFLFFI